MADPTAPLTAPRKAEFDRQLRARHTNRGQLSESLHEFAASTQVCTDVASAVRLLNTRKFETVVVDLQMGDESRNVLERVRLSPSNSTTIAFAVTETTKESAIAFEAGSNFVLERPLSTRSVGRTLEKAYGMIMRERLRYFRCAISSPATILKDNAGIPCQVFNISEGGMAVTVPVPLKPGEELVVETRIPCQASAFSARIEVCWYDEKGRAGVRFLTISAEQGGELREWLSKQLEDSLPESLASRFRAST